MATPGNRTVSSSNSRRYRYTKVLDNRKHPIRGLWRRNGSFVGGSTVEDDGGRKAVKDGGPGQANLQPVSGLPAPHCQGTQLEAKEQALPKHLQRFGFQDRRHDFISYAVMSGIYFM